MYIINSAANDIIIFEKEHDGCNCVQLPLFY